MSRRALLSIAFALTTIGVVSATLAHAAIVHAPSITGRVLDGNGDAVASASVALFSGGQQIALTTSRPDGYYSFSGVRPGTYKVYAKAGDGREGSATAVVRFNIPTYVEVVVGYR